MKQKFGYLLPTRERVMKGQLETAPLLALAEKAEDQGYDSIWVGDSLVARPRHDPLTTLAAISSRTQTVELGTAVLLPALRNPVALAQTAATVDQLSEGRLILAVGIASDLPNVRAEFEAAGVPFEKRVGRMMEGIRLCQALWTGDAVEWNGRWNVNCETLGILPNRPGGPPIWGVGTARGSLERAGRYLDGWLPFGPDAETIGKCWRQVQEIASSEGRTPQELTCAAYLTVSIDENLEKAQEGLDEYLQSYYGASTDLLKSMMACFAGPLDEAGQWLQDYVDAGARHIVLRFAGDNEKHLDMFMKLRADHGW